MWICHVMQSRICACMSFVNPVKLLFTRRQQSSDWFSLSFFDFVMELICAFWILHATWWCTWWRSWLRHCATSRKVAGLIPDGVIGIFHWRNPSGHTLALGLTQPLTEMSSRNISCGGKCGWCVGLTTLPPSCADCLEIWEPQPPGTLRACPGLSWDC